MALPLHFLAVYGYVLLFAWVLGEQLGIPLPATPVLIAAGALSVHGVLSFPLVFLSSLAAALVSDCSWFLYRPPLRARGAATFSASCRWSPRLVSAARRILLAARAAPCCCLPSLFPAWPCWPRPWPARTAWASRRFCSSTASAPRSGSARGSSSAACSATLLRRDPRLLGWAGALFRRAAADRHPRRSGGPHSSPPRRSSAAWPRRASIPTN